jgi:hypothetical protein
VIDSSDENEGSGSEDDRTSSISPLSCELNLNSCAVTSVAIMTERKAKRMALDKIRKPALWDPLPPFFALLVSQSMTMAGRIRSGDAVLEIFFNMLQGHDPMIRGMKSPPNHWFVRVTIREIMKLWQTVFILMMCGRKDSRMASLFLPLLFYFSELCFLTSPRAHTDCVERKDSPAILITRVSSRNHQRI